MTEPEFLSLLTTKFRFEDDKSLVFSSPTFAEDFFKRNPKDATKTLILIFQHSICEKKPLSEPEKAIVRYVKTWPNKTPYLQDACNVFFESDLTA